MKGLYRTFDYQGWPVCVESGWWPHTRHWSAWWPPFEGPSWIKGHLRGPL